MLRPGFMNNSNSLAIPLGTTISDSKKNPDNANKPHDDIFLPKKLNNIIDKT